MPNRMLNSFEARYFDGKSSSPQQITVVFQSEILGLELRIRRDEKINWPLTDIQFERFGDLIEIRNDNFSGAMLKIDDAAFAKVFYAAMKRNKRVDIHTRLVGLGLLKITGIALGLLGLIVGAYFFILPPIAEKSAALLPESFDDEIGNVFIENYLDKVEVDTARSLQLQAFAGQLKLKNHKSLRFTVVESAEINAFALPNGHIVVFSGILDNMESADELAALLGHEVSHVNARHSTKMLCRNLAGYMLVSLLFSDVNGVMAVLAENAQQLHSLSYSRNFEQEADEQGLRILVDNHVNPGGMIQLFERLDREKEISIPKIISTHPLTEDRKAHMEEMIGTMDYQVVSNPKLASIFKALTK